MTGSSLIVASLFVFFGVVSCKLPEYIKLCKNDDPNVDKCIINSIEYLKSYLKAGIPELDVPSIEPLKINETITMNLGNGDTKVLTNLSDLTLHGASSFKILNLWPDIEANVFKYNVTVPTLIVNGTYEIDTKLLFLHVMGKGIITINIENYNFECVMPGTRIKIRENEHLKFDELRCEIQFEKATVRMDNLFNGNELLGNAVNDVVNENIDIFFNEIKPKLVDAISDIFTEVANKITLRFTFTELFLS